LTSSSKKILVVGGAGYIGSHTCKALAEAGMQPVVVDDLSAGHDWAVKWGPLQRCDIRDGEALDAIFAAHRPDAVLHFAAKINVGESVTAPEIYYGNNVGGTLTLLDVMRRHDCRKLVFSSSCAVYGTPQRMPLDESHPYGPINPYGASKLMAETMIADFGRAHGLAHVALRYFNAAGAEADAGIGEDHQPETHLIPLLLDAVQGRQGAITVFGDDYPTPDGTCVRDYIHVADLAAAHLKALDYLGQGGASTAFNLGNGAGYSVREVIDAVQRVTGKEVPTREGARRDGDAPELISQSSAATEALGWTPERPAIETQIEDAWRWHQAHFG
jgi:UDP-glucose-4-epimerase GalE|tara:strand:- start:717 stop:1706 length:990 start_codon:yes stop_codon:yes gene_type:complete